MREETIAGFVGVILGAVLGASLEWLVRKSIESDEINTNLHSLYTDVEIKLIYLENVESELNIKGLLLQPFSLQAFDAIFSSKAAILLRGDVLVSLINCRLKVADFNLKLVKGEISLQHVPAFGDKNALKKEISPIKNALCDLLLKLIKLSEKIKFIPTIKI